MPKPDDADKLAQDNLIERSKRIRAEGEELKKRFDELSKQCDAVVSKADKIINKKSKKKKA